MIGQIISRYRITEKLGEGGMGVVYKADDTKLERSVALKFLPAHLLGNEDVRKRFEREAKAAAGLHHANICPVYEIDEADGRSFISMAFIEGESLDKKISRGPLKLEQASDIAQQVARGLEAAHEKGIFHRDIKPENIIVDSKGDATIMDFGLAQLAEASRLTRADETMGTVAYMSPEQTEGSGTDHRTDIWSLGVVIYEMVTGQQPFKGDYDKAVMYSILNEEPAPLTSLRTNVPVELEVLVGKCLAKEAGLRYQHADELRVDLESLRSRLGSGRSAVLPRQRRSSVETSGTHSTPSPWVQRLPWAIAGTLALTLVVLALPWPSAEAPSAPVRRFSFAFPGVKHAAISPNGMHIAYETPDGIWIQDLDQDEPRLLHHTGEKPFWSPDSLLIGFYADSGVWKIPARGGSADLLCEEDGPFLSAAWSPDGESVVFVGSTEGTWALLEVSALGGTPHPLISVDEFSPSEASSTLLQEPSFLLHDSRRLLVFTMASYAAANLVRESKIVVRDLNSGQTEILGDGAEPLLTRSGHLVFRGDGDRLWALPISLRTLRPQGDAFPIAQLGMSASLAMDGSLTYVVPSRRNMRLAWHDREGNVLEAVGGAKREIRFPDLSRDGNFAVAESVGNIWLHDLGRGLATSVTAGPEQDAYPVWAPWGAIFRRAQDLYYRPLDLSKDAQLLLGNEERLSIYDVDSTGQHIVFGQTADGGWNLWRLERDPQAVLSEPAVFFESELNTINGEISPDGRFLAYAASRRGQGYREVFVQPFPGGGSQVKVSVGPGDKLRWNPSGGELFYVDEDTMMAVEVTTEPQFRAGKTTQLFSNPWLRTLVGRPTYAVSPDGNRFLFAIPDAKADGPPPKVQLVQNWYEEFRDQE